MPSDLLAEFRATPWASFSWSVRNPFNPLSTRSNDINAGQAPGPAYGRRQRRYPGRCWSATKRAGCEPAHLRLAVQESIAKELLANVGPEFRGDVPQGPASHASPQASGHYCPGAARRRIVEVGRPDAQHHTENARGVERLAA